jgi:uncharacterized membrane protein
MSNDRDYVERTIETPTTVRQETMRVVRTPNSAGWWIAAVVAIVAIVGVIFLMNNGTSTTDLQAARDQGAVQAQTDSAATGAQMAATQAAQSAQSAAESNARTNDVAARAAADRSAATANNVAAASRDAAATEPAPPTPPQ